MKSRKLDIMMISLIYFFVISIFFAIPILDFNSTITSLIRIGFFSLIWLYFLYHFIKQGNKKIDKKIIVYIVLFFLLQVVIFLVNEGVNGISKTSISLMLYPTLCMILYLIFCNDYELEKNRLTTFCFAITLFVIYACLYNLFFHFDEFKNIFSLKSSYDLQFTSFFKNRNTFSVLLLIGLFSSTIGLLNDNRKKKMWIIFLIVILFNLVFTFSRAAIFAGVIFVGLLIILNKKLRKNILGNKKIVIGFTALVLLIFLVPYTRNYIMDNIIRLSSGTTNRDLIMDYCIEYFKSHNYLIGNGYIAPYIDFAKHFIYIGFHNSFITVLICQGIIGLIMYLILLAFSLKNSIKLKKYNDMYGSIFIAIFFSSMFYFFFESRVLFTLEFIDYAFTLFITIIPMYLLNSYHEQQKYIFNKSVKHNKDLISVIVPVYNVEPYLKRSLTSLREQTYKKIEVIIVDDGATDNSYKVCESFVKKDKRFKLYHKENGGISSARNYGIEKATGKYLYFMDSDDYLDKDIIKVLYDLMISNNVDLSMVGYNYTYEDNERANENNLNKYNYLTRDELLEKIMIRGSFAGYVWNKLYKKELIGNLRFNEEIQYREDMLFNCLYIENAQSGVYYTSPYYHYVQREGSLLNQNDFKEKMISQVYSLEKIRDIYIKERIDTTRAEYELLKCCFNLKYRISISKDDFSSYLKIINEKIDKYFPIIMANSKFSKIRKIEIKLSKKYPTLICGLKTKLSKMKEALYE